MEWMATLVFEGLWNFIEFQARAFAGLLIVQFHAYYAPTPFPQPEYHPVPPPSSFPIILHHKSYHPISSPSPFLSLSTTSQLISGDHLSDSVIFDHLLCPYYVFFLSYLQERSLYLFFSSYILLAFGPSQSILRTYSCLLRVHPWLGLGDHLKCWVS